MNAKLRNVEGPTQLVDELNWGPVRRDTRDSASHFNEFKDALLDGEALRYELMVNPCR